MQLNVQTTVELNEEQILQALAQLKLSQLVELLSKLGVHMDSLHLEPISENPKFQEVDEYGGKPVCSTQKKYRSPTDLDYLFVTDLGFSRSTCPASQTEMCKVIYRLNPKFIGVVASSGRSYLPVVKQPNGKWRKLTFKGLEKDYYHWKRNVTGKWQVELRDGRKPKTK